MWWLDAESPSHPTNSSETLKHGGTQPRDQHTQVIADWVAKSDLQDKSIDQLQKQIACHQDESQQTKNQLESQIELQCSQIANLESHAQSQETQFLQQLAQSQDALRTAESEHVQTRDQQAQIIADWVAKSDSQDKTIDQLQKQIACHQEESQQTKNQLDCEIEQQRSQIANLESHAQSQETQFSQQLAQSQDALRTAESEHVQTRDQQAEVIVHWVAKSESQDKTIDQLQSFIETLNAQATAREGLLNQKLVQF